MCRSHHASAVDSIAVRRVWQQFSRLNPSVHSAALRGGCCFHPAWRMLVLNGCLAAIVINEDYYYYYYYYIHTQRDRRVCRVTTQVTSSLKQCSYSICKQISITNRFPRTLPANDGLTQEKLGQQPRNGARSQNYNTLVSFVLRQPSNHTV